MKTASAKEHRAGVDNRNSDDVREVVARLHDRYRSPRHGNKEDPVDELIFILLSQMTRHQAFNRAYNRLRARFASWGDILVASDHQIAECIETAGLTNKRLHTLRRILEEIRRCNGSLNLNFLRQMSTADALEYLQSLPGIGPKLARCVLLYSCAREVLPIDTHTRRVAVRLGWLGAPEIRDEHSALEMVVPPELRYAFHVNAICLGREVCLPMNPRCAQCPIQDLCGYGRGQ